MWVARDFNEFFLIHTLFTLIFFFVSNGLSLTATKFTNGTLSKGVVNMMASGGITDLLCNATNEVGFVSERALLSVIGKSRC